MNARLIIIEGELLGKSIPVATDTKHVIGREAPATVQIPDDSISAQHAEIELRGNQLHVRDLGSTNQIFHNGAQVSEITVSDGDVFAVGQISMRFETGEELPDIIIDFRNKIQFVKDEMGRIIIGQCDVINQLLSCIFAGGHCLIVGVPGLAKTAIVNSLARILDLQFKRVQFTPDLMPSDITGTNIIDTEVSGARGMKFVQGPIFTQLLLADEINRTPPKTQAALLEAMQERQVTIGVETRELPAPFIVVATQNPIEQEGTYPLPEAQLDRFMYNVLIDYPSLSEEEEILRRTTTKEEIPVRQVLDGRGILRFQKAVQQVEVAPYVIAYVAKLVRCTRPRDDDALDHTRETLEWGAGPRAGQYLIWGGKAMAAMDGRLSVSCDDIRSCAIPVLRHRISANFQAQASGITNDDIIRKLLDMVPEPEIAKYVEGDA